MQDVDDLHVGVSTNVFVLSGLPRLQDPFSDLLALLGALIESCGVSRAGGVEPSG